MMPDLAVELLMPPLMEKITKRRRTSPSTWCRGAGRRSSPPSSPAPSTSSSRSATPLRAFTASASIPTAMRWRCAAGIPLAQAEEARGVPGCAACRRRHPRPERGPDRYLAAGQGHRAADCAGGARLYRGAARHRAHRPRRLRAAPPDRRAGEAIVAGDHHAAVRSRDRRAVSCSIRPAPRWTPARSGCATSCSASAARWSAAKKGVVRLSAIAQCGHEACLPSRP